MHLNPNHPYFPSRFPTGILYVLFVLSIVRLKQVLHVKCSGSPLLFTLSLSVYSATVAVLLLTGSAGHSQLMDLSPSLYHLIQCSPPPLQPSLSCDVATKHMVRLFRIFRERKCLNSLVTTRLPEHERNRFADYISAMMFLFHTGKRKKTK